MTKIEILEKALDLVGGNRHNAYGDAFSHYSAVAAVWNGILDAAGKPVTLEARDIPNLLEGLKIARRYCGPFREDNYIDGAGYAAVAAECAEHSSSATEHAKSPFVQSSRSMQQGDISNSNQSVRYDCQPKKQVDR